ncbi:TRAP transporter substrate-binding protein [Azohydromonas sp.]|uniref:TRAP transporter substrate-binding protein n=1 Tax=Azohydromonas sp. TaxID=1872666 RepID=UPI002CDFBB32|nr:TRAP transporter substrate-binding protein [Azohydromonas sp.]HMM85174.1 TRAP transporter substrate-binding protein [Azohydromonas sp.]
MKITRKAFLGTLGAAATLALAPSAFAQTITLRFHQFLPPQAPIPSKAIAPWAEKIEKDSGGRIKVQQFPSMQLGGRPPELFDQAKDGVVDIIWTVLGYTPGRFPKSEVFELPFMTGSAEASSRAFQAYVEKHAMDEFKDVKLIAVHTHGPGLFHSKDPINKLEDLKGMKVRGGSRIINIMLEQLGATPVGLPVPQVGEALSKGVISSTTIPWEVVPALKVHQIVKNHTGFSGDKGLYTQTFGVVMNKAKYDALPPDLKKVIDDNSGAATAALFGSAMDEGDKGGVALAQQAGNKIVMLDAAETARWQRAAAGVRDAWFKEVSAKGIDGPKLLADAEALIAQHAKK